MKALAKLTHLVDGRPRILSDPPLVVPIAELFQEVEAKQLEGTLRKILRQYRASLQNDHRVLVERFQYADAARKVVGVGSVGTRAWILLMLGRDDQDPLFLQAKEAGSSVLEAFVGASAFKNHGQRVVEGQRLMQASSDIFLGWVSVTGIDGVKRDFYVRQLWDWKASAEHRGVLAKGAGSLRPDVRLDACQSPRALGRPDRDRRLSRLRSDLRRGCRGLLGCCMPTRIRPTTTRSSSPSMRGGCRRRPGCEGGGRHSPTPSLEPDGRLRCLEERSARSKASDGRPSGGRV